MTDEPNQQSDFIRDYVFPIAAVTQSGPGERRFERLLGTGFLIGRRGFALTATHVLNLQANEISAGMFVQDGKWRAHDLTDLAVHPTEDVALIKLEGRDFGSICRLGGTWEGQSARYMSWGYPEDVLHEVVREGHAAARPDLVYSEGYIRRRLSDTSLPLIKGSQFFELSDQAGGGCSGSPLLKRVNQETWPLIGIYLGERTNDSGVRVGYAVREEAFRDWSPDLLGQTVMAESEV